MRYNITLPKFIYAGLLASILPLSVFADVPTVPTIDIPPGFYAVGETIEGVYTFFDPDGDPEENSEIRFLLSPNSDGSGSIVIAPLMHTGDDPFELTVPNNRGQYIGFSVTPRDNNTEVGAVTYSTWEKINSLPVGNTETFGGVNEGGSFTINDPMLLINASDGDDETQPITAIWESGPNYSTSFSLDADGTFSYQHDGSENHVDTFYYYVFDGVEQSADEVMAIINITPIEEPPVLSHLEATARQYTEGDGLVNVTSTIRVRENDRDTIESATITISSNYLEGEDYLRYTSTSLTVDWDASTGVLEITGEATASQYQTVLRNVRYENINTVDPSTNNRIIQFRVHDGTSGSNLVSRTISLSAENDAPTALPDSYTGIPEGGSLTTTLGVNDILLNDEDLDGPPPMQAVLVDDVEHGYLTLNSNGTFTYEHDSSEAHTDAFTYYAYDGLDPSLTVTVSLDMDAVNDPPLLDNIGTDTLLYQEDDPSRIITTTITAVDVDNIQVESATISIVQGFVSGEDSLVFPTVPGLTIDYDTLTGILTASGIATPLVYQNSLFRNIRYWNTNTENPSTAFRRVRFVLNDGEDDSEPIERVIEVEAQNDPPEADNATLLGTDFYVGELITVDYDFTDPDSDDEGISTFRWYTADDNLGTNRTPINATIWNTDTFTIRLSEGGRYLHAVVRPRDENGVFGLRDTTGYFYVNAAPVLSGFSVVNTEHPGAFAVGETVRANFTFTDLEDLEGEHSYQWYWSANGNWENSHAITDAITDTFLIRQQDTNRLIALEAIPEALSGSTPGAVHRSAWHAVGETPSANIAGSTGTENDSICLGETDTLIVTLGGSNAPWTFSYTIDGLGETTISDIEEEDSEYKLAVTQAGLYELTNVSDTRYDFGILSGEVEVAYYDQPTATMADDELPICDNDEASYGIAIELTGTAPWQVSYQYAEDADSATLVNIDTAYAEIPVTIDDAGIYELLHVWDAHCMDVGTGTTEVITKENPSVTLTGDTAVCPGDDATLMFELEGNGPWGIYYTLNDGEPIRDTVNIPATSYTHEILVSDPGIYEVIRVIDMDDVGCAYGTIEVTTHELPTATIAGTDTICDGGIAEFDVALTGTQPWSIFYVHATNPAVEVTGIMEDTYTIEASKGGAYYIAGVDDANGCGGSEAGIARLHVDPLPEVELIMNQTIFTINSEPEPISVSPSGGSFANSSSSIPISEEEPWLFYPDYAHFFYISKPGKGNPFYIRYTYQDELTGCSTTEEVAVNVLAQGAEISFLDSVDYSREMYCFNADTIKVQGLNQWSIPDGEFSITGGVGIENVGNNLAYIYPWQISSGIKTLTYEVTYDEESGDTERAQISMNFEVINGDFVWDNECFDDEALVNFGDNSTATQEWYESEWNFFTDEGTFAQEGFETSFTFDKRNEYTVEHIISTQLNNDICYDTVQKQLFLKPTFDVGNVPYDESFNYGTNFWTSKSVTEGATNSWDWDIPDGAGFNGQGSGKAWYTHIANNSQGEQSYVISPCFDFRTSYRPMIKFDLWRELTQIDGAVLQYTLNNGAEWNTVGAPDDGINWYNSFTVSGNPGGQTLGWTNTNDATWHEARHKLDALIGKTQVQFRIAYGATGGISTIERDGLAFDNIWIGDRKKNVLFEYITNTTDATVAEINEEINALVNKEEHASDIIDLHYFANSSDPFNQLNPTLHNWPGYYYSGITAYPYGIIDGGRGDNSDYLIDFADGEELTDNDLTLAALDEYEFEINLETKKGGGIVDIDVTVTSLENRAAANLTLHVVIVEETVELTGASGQTHYKNVVKEMIPDPIGTSLSQSFTANTPLEYSYIYTYQDIYDESQVRVVAYIQDEDTREVLQAAKLNPNIANSINDAAATHSTGFELFPNPARDYTYINFQRITEYDRKIAIYSVDGHVIDIFEIEAGEDRAELRLTTYQSGIYIVKMFENNELIGAQKLVKVK